MKTKVCHQIGVGFLPCLLSAGSMILLTVGQINLAPGRHCFIVAYSPLWNKKTTRRQVSHTKAVYGEGLGHLFPESRLLVCLELRWTPQPCEGRECALPTKLPISHCEFPLFSVLLHFPLLQGSPNTLTNSCIRHEERTGEAWLFC